MMVHGRPLTTGYSTTINSENCNNSSEQFHFYRSNSNNNTVKSSRVNSLNSQSSRVSGCISLQLCSGLVDPCLSLSPVRVSEVRNPSLTKQMSRCFFDPFHANWYLARLAEIVGTIDKGWLIYWKLYYWSVLSIFILSILSFLSSNLFRFSKGSVLLLRSPGFLGYSVRILMMLRCGHTLTVASCSLPSRLFSVAIRHLPHVRVF